MSRSVVAVLALVILATAGVWGLQASLETAGQDQTVVNETWTPTAGSVTTLDESNRDGAYYDHNVTVYDTSGAEVDRGDDYRWYPGNGTVEAVAGGELDGDRSANITYGYQQTTGEQRAIAAALGRIPQFIGLIIPVAAVVLFLAFLRG